MARRHPQAHGRARPTVRLGDPDILPDGFRLPPDDAVRAAEQAWLTILRRRHPSFSFAYTETQRRLAQPGLDHLRDTRRGGSRARTPLARA